MAYVPHIDLLLRALRITRERLDGRARIVVEAPLLRALLRQVAAAALFDEAFYLATYPDIAAAHADGLIADPRRHFIEFGFFEGRAPAPPPVDEDYYVARYDDVRGALRGGDIGSGAEHYLRAGAAEGRVPSAALRPVVEGWMLLLHGAEAR